MKQAERFVDSHRNEIFAMLDAFVRCESYVKEPEHVSEMACLLRKALEDSGAVCHYHRGGNMVGLSVSGTWNSDADAAPVLLLGHLDTVFPKGSWDASECFVKDGILHGPGCCDMKGGAVAAVWIVRTLRHIGYHKRPIHAVFVSDEEVGHTESDNIAWIRQEGAGAVIALNLEPGRRPNRVTIGRKGCLRATITVHGTPAHSGNSFSQGKNAIVEMAYKIEKLHQLTDLDAGTTVSCNVISGGTVFNCVPGTCTLAVDCRFQTLAEQERLRHAITAICNEASVTGAETTVQLENVSLPFETTDAVRRLYQFSSEISQRFGYGDLESLQVGGSSDICHLSSLGIPALCSAGIVGGNLHTHAEWADMESLLQRIKLWTAVIAHLDEGFC